MEKKKLVIIGSGPAGYTAAIYAARANLTPVLYEGFMSGVAGGQLMTTTEVENYPGFPGGVTGPTLMDYFRKQAMRFGTIVLTEDVISVDFSKRPFCIKGSKTEYEAESVIIATGATAKSKCSPPIENFLVVIKFLSLIISCMEPTYEELEHQLEKTEKLLKQALNHIIELEGRIAKLEEQLKLNSKNSSKPPSTDQKADTKKPSPKKPRKGHPGVNRTPYPKERIDRHIKCTRETCPHCGLNSLQENSLPSDYLQQVDLPEVRAIVTQYELIKYHCQTCHKHSLGKLPTEVSPSSFGPKLTALLSLLTGVYHLAKREAKQLIQNLYDIDIGTGSIPNIEEKITKALTPVYERIHHFAIQSASCKHFDETSWRNSGEKHYVWIATTQHAALYKIHPNRSKKAFEELALGKCTFQAVTDRYATYNTLGKDHQYCLAHLIRECHRWSERDGPDGKIGEKLETFLKRSCKAHQNFLEKKITLKERNRVIGHCRHYFDNWLGEGMTSGSDLLWKWSMHLDKTLFKLWTFSRFSDMDPTNNLAERNLRKIVIWRKKSYGTRSERGKRFVERITSVAQTLKKQGINILKFIQEALLANIAGREAPYMCLSMGF